MKIDWSSFGIEQSSSVTENTISQTQTLLGVRFPNLHLDLATYSDKSSPETSYFPYNDKAIFLPTGKQQSHRTPKVYSHIKNSNKSQLSLVISLKLDT